MFLFAGFFWIEKELTYTQTWVKKERDKERKQSMEVLNKVGPSERSVGPTHTAHAHAVFLTNIKPIIHHRSDSFDLTLTQMGFQLREKLKSRKGKKIKIKIKKEKKKMK